MLFNIICSDCKNPDEEIELYFYNQFLPTGLYQFILCKDCIEKRNLKFKLKKCTDCDNQIIKYSVIPKCGNCNTTYKNYFIYKLKDPVK